nr:NLR family CARD domain-containing protein 3-like [Paramormyrops kingsleyae]
MERADSPAPSCVSMKVDKSMRPPIEFRKGPFPTDQSVLMERADSPAPSCVSMKSDKSMRPPIEFRKGPFPTDQRDQMEECSSDLQEKLGLSSISKSLEENAVRFLKDELKKITRYLDKNYPECSEPQLEEDNDQDSDGQIQKTCGREGALKITLYILRTMKQNDLADLLEKRHLLLQCHRRIKCNLRKKCECVFEEKAKDGQPTLLSEIYTELYITEGGTGVVNDEHEVRGEFSLIELLHRFVPELKSFESTELFRYKVLFIFDGLDECRLPLDFRNNDSWFDVTKKTSLDVLLTNLIKGNLLPSALLWITSRPAAANQIPPGSIHRVTEIRGFSDSQKEEYFRRRFSDQSLASRIITHVKSSRSLFIMCHIPVFCWISATVLERLFSETDRGEIPRTLTEMYTHFLIFQTSLKNDKYMKNCETKLKKYSKKFLLKLGKLAFDNLEKGNLIFYEQDLTGNDIDVSEASVYSGVCTEVFKKEYGLYQEKVYCFVHLSIQEYLAALYVFLSNSSADVLKTSVDQALMSKNGHLDLYLRFLLGLSTDSSKTLLQRLLGLSADSSMTLLQRLLGKTTTSSHDIKETAQYIKEKIKENLSPERTINLFHCLNELGDNSLVEEAQRYLNSGRLSAEDLSPAQYSALAFVLLMSDEKLDVFDLKKFVRSDKEHWRLLPVVKTSRTALLDSCNLTENCCETLASALRSNSSPLRELDLSNNDLQDSAVKLLSAGLGDSQCKLGILRLSGCRVTEEGCSSLASALRSNPSHLRQLDLSYNHPGDSGVKLLSAVLEDPSCKLEKLK